MLHGETGTSIMACFLEYRGCNSTTLELVNLIHHVEKLAVDLGIDKL
jgi:hypothetical protein